MFQTAQAKKLVLVLAAFLSVTAAIREAWKVRVLNKVPCICYPIQFRKDKNKDVLPLLNSGSKVNAMIPAYTFHLGLIVRMTNVDVHKINESSLAPYSMITTVFQVVNKLGRSRFFQETFLLANISIKVILGKSFFTFSNVDL